MDKGENLSSKKNPLQRSISSFGFNVGNSSIGVREAKSFTGSLQELKSIKKQVEHGPNYYIKIVPEQQVTKECEFITKEVLTDKILVVNSDMLNYRGKQYSMNDIATRWKKDCRMWLWKGNLSKRNKSVSEIYDKMQSLKIPPSSDIFKGFRKM